MLFEVEWQEQELTIECVILSPLYDGIEVPPELIHQLRGVGATQGGYILPRNYLCCMVRTEDEEPGWLLYQLMERVAEKEVNNGIIDQSIEVSEVNVFDLY